MPEPDSELVFVNRPISRKATSALALRTMGASLEEVMSVVGFSSIEEAARAIDKALSEELRSDPRQKDKMRAVAGRGLQRLLRSVSSKALNEEHPEHLQAVGKAKEVYDRYIRLYGLDAPTEITVHNPKEDEIARWVTQMVAMTETDELEEDDVLDAEVVDESTEEDGQ